MEALLKKMKRDFGEILGEGKKSKDEELKAAVMLIYNASKVRISKVADNMVRGQILEEETVKLMENPKEIALPELEEWDFELGDTVKIKLSRDDFKWMQKNTLGWRCDLNQLVGQVGIVTNVFCKYENAIGVYFPDVFVRRSLYAGVLEKVPPREDSKLLRRWKPGDFVKPVSPSKVLQLLQKGLVQIPDKYAGKTGKVIYATHPCVIVTFDGKRTFDFKSSSLVESEKDEIKKKEVDHARGIKVGDTVKIISNLKKLIKNQKDHGRWNSSMTPIRGEKATVIRILKDGSLNLQTRHNRAWRVHSDSVLLSEDEELQSEDLKLLPGDIVKVSVPRNIRSILAMAEVPFVFLEYLRAPAIVACVDDDFDYFIRFNHDQNLQTCEEIMRKATSSEREIYEKVQGLTDNLKVGDPVHLDIGPPNFVQSMISDMNLSPQVQMALTKSAVLIGYTNAYTAVIRYDDGSRFRVKKKFLIVPEKFRVDETKYSVSLETVVDIKDVISRSIQDLHNRKGAATEDWSVSLIHMREGNPPWIEFRIKTTVPDSKSIFSWLEENSGWSIEEICDGQFIAVGADKSNEKMEVKIAMIFNDEISEFDSYREETHTVSGVINEGPSSLGNKARPFNTENNGDAPTVTDVNQFRYVCLYDAALAQNVYFPYVVQGNRRRPERAESSGDHPLPPTYREATNYLDNA